jgi:signal transduction histidine kinase
LLGAVLLATLAAVFGSLGPAGDSWLRQAYLLIPSLIWAAVRFGPRGASRATLLASAGAIWGTALGHGPFARGTLHEGLLPLQLFMSVVAITFLILGALTAERHELLERERSARAVAERAVRVRDDFLAVASHELRTPLTPLQLQLEGVLRAAESGDPRLSARVERALLQGERLARLIDGLLDVSRLASGKLELSVEDCDMTEIVKSALDHVKDQAEKAGSPLRVVAQGPIAGRWDRGRTEQLLSNLLSNAIKYGRGSPIEVSIGTAHGYVEIAVHDGGIGVPAEAHTRIFERFERAAPSREYDGLGLGLYVAREIALAHRGEIAVKSKPNVGSTFTVRLPLLAVSSA